MANQKICAGCERRFTPTNKVLVLCDSCGGRNRQDSQSFRAVITTTQRLNDEQAKRLARTNWETQ